MTAFWASPGYVAEKMDIFLAEDLTEGAQEPMDDERIEIRWFERDEVGAMIQRGEILDGKTMIGYFHYAMRRTA